MKDNDQPQRPYLSKGTQKSQLMKPYQPRISYVKKIRKAGALLVNGSSINQVAKKLNTSVRLVKKWVITFDWQLPKPEPKPVSAKVLFEWQLPKPEPKPVSAKVLFEWQLPEPLPKPVSAKVLLQQYQQEKAAAKAAQLAQVKEMVVAGRSQTEIFKSLNLTYYRFYKHLQQLSIQPESQVRTEQKERARQLYELAEIEPADIEQELQLKPGTVKQWVQYEKWDNGKDTILDVQWKARCMYEIKGIEQNEIAKQCNVSEKSISNWKRKDKWRKLVKESAIQLEARNLFENEGMQQKQIAAKCHVSEKSICVWRQRYKWQLKPA